MDTDLTGLRWFKSSASSAAGCVEIAHLPDGGVALRDSKDRDKTPHVFNRHEWECFLFGAKKGNSTSLSARPCRLLRSAGGDDGRGATPLPAPPVPSSGRARAHGR
jgi:hypothetical protein